MYFTAALWPLNIRAGRRLVKVAVGAGGDRLMRWTRRGIDDARAWQARRPVTFTLAVAGAVILAATGIGCGHSTDVGSGPGCPTKGVGGDTLAPLCVSQPEGSTGGTTGINGPPTVTATPPPSPSIAGPVGSA